MSKQVNINKIYTFKELYNMFQNKILYERKIVGNDINIVPTKICMKLRLIIANQNNKAQGYEYSLSDYFGLQLN